MTQTAEIQFLPYDDQLLNLMKRYAADMEHLVDESYTAQHPEVATRIYDMAKRLEGSPSQWGGVVPGVSLDCAGSVMTLLVSSGLFNYPKGIFAYNSKGGRNRDFEDSSITLNKRMAIHLLLFALRCNKEHVMCIPVVDPETIYPGDVVTPPYVALMQGRALPPHTAVFVSKGTLMTAMTDSKSIKLVNVKSCDVSVTPGTFIMHGQIVIVWRVIDRKHHDALAKKREYEILEYIKAMKRELDEEELE
jgi:hypothetical protein